MKKKINMFVSYAHNNNVLVDRFLDEFEEYCHCSKTYEYNIWRDHKILIGEKWEEEIIKAIDECDCGLLLLSTSFLNSPYIKNVELVKLTNDNKILLPVGFRKFNLERHDLLGLKEKQIFMYRAKGSPRAKFFSDIKGQRRTDFIDALFVEIEDRLNKEK